MALSTPSWRDTTDSVSSDSLKVWYQWYSVLSSSRWEEEEKEFYTLLLQLLSYGKRTIFVVEGVCIAIHEAHMRLSKTLFRIQSLS